MPVRCTGGATYLADLAKEGVDTTHVNVNPDIQTACGPVLVCQETGDRLAVPFYPPEQMPAGAAAWPPAHTQLADFDAVLVDPRRHAMATALLRAARTVRSPAQNPCGPHLHLCGGPLDTAGCCWLLLVAASCCFPCSPARLPSPSAGSSSSLSLNRTHQTEGGSVRCSEQPCPRSRLWLRLRLRLRLRLPRVCSLLQANTLSVLDADITPDAQEMLLPLCKLADHVVFSLGGLLSLAPPSLPSQSLAKASDATDGHVAAVLRAVGAQLQAQSPGKTVGVTLGERGFAWLAADSKTVHQIAAPKVVVVDTLSCGDVFHGVYTVVMAKQRAAAAAAGQASKKPRLDHNHAVYTAAKWGCAAAALKCRHFGGRLGSPSKDELETFMQDWDPPIRTLA